MPALRHVVVDSSVVLKWVLPEAGRSKALALLDEYEAGQTDLIAPGLLMEECASALSTRCRRGDLTKADARVAFRLLELRQPVLVDEPAQLRASFELSVLHHLSFWDSIYLALAIDKRCDIVTADRRFRTRSGNHYPFVTLLGEEPARR